MDTESFAAWVAALGMAWETKDASAAADLFAEDAIYQEDSFAEPMCGRDAIFAYWSEAPATQDRIRFASEVLAVNGNMGIAHWWVSLVRVPSGRTVKLDGVFVVTMDDRHLGKVFREWWQKEEDDGNAA